MKDNNIKNLDIKKIRLWFYISGAFFVISIILSISVYLLSNKKNDININDVLKKHEEQKKLEKSNKIFSRLIDGVLVEEKNVNPPIIGIMIDNHVDARPPAGIEQANLVFEAEAEGGITRYLAFFTADQEIDEIGPIRSARPYYVDWAQEINALYVHVGGSPAALVKMQKENIFHINEFYNGSYFWRGKDYFAPHNVFSSMENLKEYLNRNEKARDEFEIWNFQDEKLLEERIDSHEIKISYVRNFYDVKWKYDKDNNNYIRFLASKPHVTKNSEIITTKNIAVMFVDSEEIDEKLRLEMDNIGNGEAVICHEGDCEKGVWEKTSKKSRTQFYYDDGTKMEFVQGNTWVEVVKPEYEINY